MLCHVGLVCCLYPNFTTPPPTPWGQQGVPVGNAHVPCRPTGGIEAQDTGGHVTSRRSLNALGLRPSNPPYRQLPLLPEGGEKETGKPGPELAPGPWSSGAGGSEMPLPAAQTGSGDPAQSGGQRRKHCRLLQSGPHRTPASRGPLRPVTLHGGQAVSACGPGDISLAAPMELRAAPSPPAVAPLWAELSPPRE